MKKGKRRGVGRELQGGGWVGQGSADKGRAWGGGAEGPGGRGARPLPHCRRPGRPERAGPADHWPSTLEHPHPRSSTPTFQPLWRERMQMVPDSGKTPGRGAGGAGYWRGMRAQGAGGPVPIYPAQSFPSAARGQPGPAPESSLSPLATSLPSRKVGLGMRAAPEAAQAGAPAHSFSPGRKLWPGAHVVALTPEDLF